MMACYMNLLNEKGRSQDMLQLITNTITARTAQVRIDSYKHKLGADRGVCFLYLKFISSKTQQLIWQLFRFSPAYDSNGAHVVLQQILHLHYSFPDLQAKIENYLSTHLDIRLTSKNLATLVLKEARAESNHHLFALLSVLERKPILGE